MDARGKERYIEWAGGNADRCAEKHPDVYWPGLFLQQLNIYKAFITSDPAGFRLVRSTISDYISDADLSESYTHREWAFLHNLRAQASDFLGEVADAEHDYDDSIKWDPFEP